MYKDRAVLSPPFNDVKFRKREPTEKKQFLLPGQGEVEVYSHTNPPKVFIGGFDDNGEVILYDN